MQRIRTHGIDGLYWLVTYGILWFLFSGGTGWWFGLPAIVLASAAAVWLRLRPWHLRFRLLPGFVIFFFAKMLFGAWDVARRALHPQRPIEPGWISYNLRSHNPRVRLLCSTMVGLLPGSLASHISQNELHVHVLDKRQNAARILMELEDRLDRLLPMSPGEPRTAIERIE